MDSHGCQGVGSPAETGGSSRAAGAGTGTGGGAAAGAGGAGAGSDAGTGRSIAATGWPGAGAFLRTMGRGATSPHGGGAAVQPHPASTPSSHADRMGFMPAPPAYHPDPAVFIVRPVVPT
jgi:hypothetical protein